MGVFASSVTTIHTRFSSDIDCEKMDLRANGEPANYIHCSHSVTLVDTTLGETATRLSVARTIRDSQGALA